MPVSKRTPSQKTKLLIWLPNIAITLYFIIITAASGSCKSPFVLMFGYICVVIVNAILGLVFLVLKKNYAKYFGWVIVYALLSFIPALIIVSFIG
jgi:hypothetical protein